MHQAGTDGLVTTGTARLLLLLWRLKMGRGAAALYVVLMAAIIVVVDVVFFRNRFWGRLMVNIGIVLAFAAVYFAFVKRP